EQALPRLDAGDQASRAAVLHALALRNKARFESVNILLRDRAGLTDRSLAFLAMTLARLDHTGPAGEVLDLLAARARTPPGGPGPPAAPILVRRPPRARPRRRRRDDCAGRPGLRTGPARGPRGGGGPRLAAGPPRRQRLAPARGQGPGLASSGCRAGRGPRR